MTKFLSTLMIGVTLVGAAPAFADGSTSTADVIQTGKVNTIEAVQRSPNNDFASSQEGLDWGGELGGSAADGLDWGSWKCRSRRSIAASIRIPASEVRRPPVKATCTGLPAIGGELDRTKASSLMRT